MKTIEELFRRLGRARVWVALQFGLTLALILVGLAWTRLPDKHAWQVALTLLIPVLLIVSLLELQAGTMRKLADDDGKRVKLVWGAVTLLVWIALGWITWALLDWCDDQIPAWAGYLNSKASANGRVTIFSFEHLQKGMTVLEWVTRWILTPGKIVPYAMTSAQWGWRIPVRRVLRVIWNWRWWAVVAPAALVGAWLPGRFFLADPHGTVSAQVWTVGLKLAATYVLAVSGWVLVLGWAAVMFARQLPPPLEEALVAVPVGVGPAEGKKSAKVEVPPSEEDLQP